MLLSSSDRFRYLRTTPRSCWNWLQAADRADGRPYRLYADRGFLSFFSLDFFLDWGNIVLSISVSNSSLSYHALLALFLRLQLFQGTIVVVRKNAPQPVSQMSRRIATTKPPRVFKPNLAKQRSFVRIRRQLAEKWSP